MRRADVSPGNDRAKNARSILTPYLRTDVRARISAFLASVRVAQRFENPFTERIDAVYLFPLPGTAGVTDFVMRVGHRTIRGVIREREEARRIYEEARKAGLAASLLRQERPNIFTQKVANLDPGKPVEVEIRYFHPLRFVGDAYEFVFPMVVAPRYVPSRAAGGGPRVPDGTRVPVAPPPAARPGGAISIEVVLEGGVPVEGIECPSHEVEVEPETRTRSRVRLREAEKIPNRDFILRYRLCGDAPRSALLAHRGARGGFFAFLLCAPREVPPEDAAPREIVFVVDSSGSMEGAPLAQAKAVMRRFLEGLRARDTFRVIRFSEAASELSGAPLPASPENVARALRYVDEIRADGGTEMLRGVRAALEPAPEVGRARIVCFLTDGEVENEREILEAVRTLRRNARLFSFGVDESPNRYLLDKLAEEGRGGAEYVLPTEPPEPAAERFFRRLRTPCLTDVEVDFGGIPVVDVQPERLPDLFAGESLLLTGRYRGGGDSEVTIRGWRAGRRSERRAPVTFPEWEEENQVLASVWARKKIGSLMHARLPMIDEGTRRVVTGLGLDFGLVSPFTSFVAVDE